MGIKGYKVFSSDWTCRGFKYEVGKTFKHEGDIGMCRAGFHFCRKASDCFNYYNFDSRNHVAEVEAVGLVESEGDKSVTDEIHIIREIPWAELLTIVNEGKDCTGLCNTGNWNTGDWNAGNCNTGKCNTGDWNTGNRNTGKCNTGDWNTGNRNTGDWNTGNRNAGHWNTGNCNTGNWNTGNCNTGNCNTGDWNTGNCNTGFFCTGTPKLRVFNRETDLSGEEFIINKGYEVLRWNYEYSWWIYSLNMSDEEKAAHPEHETTGGYLKVVDHKTACRLMWERLDDDEKQAVKEMPNFDAQIFKEITGVDVNT